MVGDVSFMYCVLNSNVGVYWSHVHHHLMLSSAEKDCIEFRGLNRIKKFLVVIKTCARTAVIP